MFAHGLKSIKRGTSSTLKFIFENTIFAAGLLLFLTVLVGVISILFPSRADWKSDSPVSDMIRLRLIPYGLPVILFFTAFFIESKGWMILLGILALLNLLYLILESARVCIYPISLIEFLFNKMYRKHNYTMTQFVLDMFKSPEFKMDKPDDEIVEQFELFKSLPPSEQFNELSKADEFTKMFATARTPLFVFLVFYITIGVCVVLLLSVLLKTHLVFNSVYTYSNFYIFSASIAKTFGAVDFRNYFESWENSPPIDIIYGVTSSYFIMFAVLLFSSVVQQSTDEYAELIQRMMVKEKIAILRHFNKVAENSDEKTLKDV